jgi:hypothetical protein
LTWNAEVEIGVGIRFSYRSKEAGKGELLARVGVDQLISES